MFELAKHELSNRELQRLLIPYENIGYSSPILTFFAQNLTHMRI